MSNHKKYIASSPSRTIALVLLSSITWTLLSFVSNYSTSKKAIEIVDEICDNAIDDDLDGLIDLNDPDCTCESTEPVSLIPNPSFEDLDCCPDNRSQLNCATFLDPGLPFLPPT